MHRCSLAQHAPEKHDWSWQCGCSDLLTCTPKWKAKCSTMHPCRKYTEKSAKPKQWQKEMTQNCPLFKNCFNLSLKWSFLSFEEMHKLMPLTNRNCCWPNENVQKGTRNYCNAIKGITMSLSTTGAWLQSKLNIIYFDLNMRILQGYYLLRIWIVWLYIILKA